MVGADDIGGGANQDVFPNFNITVDVAVQTNVALLADLVFSNPNDSARRYSYVLSGLAKNFCALRVVMVIVTLVAVERELSKLFIT